MSLHLRGSLPHHTSEMTLNHVGGGSPVTKEEGKGSSPQRTPSAKLESQMWLLPTEKRRQTHTRCKHLNLNQRSFFDLKLNLNALQFQMCPNLCFFVALAETSYKSSLPNMDILPGMACIFCRAVSPEGGGQTTELSLQFYNLCDWVKHEMNHKETRSNTEE